MWRRKKKKEQNVVAFEKDNLCVRVKKNKRDFFFSREVYTRIIVIDLIIVKLFEICPMVFPFKEKGFFT